MLNLGQLQAVGIESAGNAFGIYELGRTNGAAAKALTDMGAALPKIPVGGVSAGQLGALTGELEASLATVPTTNSKLIDQIGSLISLVSQAQSSSGGVETFDQGVLVTLANQAAAGIANAVAFYQGEHPVS